MRVTIKDIARECDLSITTVSLVLNGKPNKISSQNAQLILDTARKLNYNRNQLAVGLVKKKSNTIGLIVPDIANIFFAEMAKGVEDMGRENGYNVIFCNSHDKHSLELEDINTLVGRGVDGILIVLSSESYGKTGEDSIRHLSEHGIPTVIVDCFDKQNLFSTIAVDNFKGSMMAMEHLLELGHRRIACITGPLGPKLNEERFLGYKGALDKYDIPYDANLVYEGDFKYNSGFDAVEKLMPYQPTAIFCHNDMMAYGTLISLKNRNLNVPKDISVIGFDDIFYSSIIEVPLTTVQQPVNELGRRAVEILTEEIRTPKTKKQEILLEPKLIIRNSVKAMNKSMV